MSLLATRRTRLAASATALLAGATLIGQASPALAATMTISAVSPVKVGAGLANKAIVVTGTNFDDELIGGISLGGDPNCAKLDNFIVSSTTQLSLKTPANGCAASSGGNAEAVTIYGTDGTTILATKPAVLTFVPAPSLADVGDKPVFTDNSSALDVTGRVQALNVAGGQVIRVKAGDDFSFDGRSAAALSGTLNGKVLTTVGFLAANGTTAQAANSAPAGPGNYWLARTAAPMTATATPSLVINQNTVSRTFASTATGLSIVAAPMITSLDVTSGKVGAAARTRIIGTSFSANPSELSVTFCGLPAPIVGATSVNSISVVVPNPAATPATSIDDLVAALGGTAGVCPVVVTRNGVSSPITSVTAFAFLDR
ncbi:hypothetical protein [Symbioplanes lichenis]|uniref:hypothetical protein n=1 Tax=Symbioplanes lichenis TaxID=1629072 RepID=UPI00273830F1|nr:hypothetical protein [Actinoplanes lichenis]